LSEDQQTTVDKFHKNFPFQSLCEQQSYVLNEIATAFDCINKAVLAASITLFFHNLFPDIQNGLSIKNQKEMGVPPKHSRI
jgi:hypothetical protein